MQPAAGPERAGVDRSLPDDKPREGSDGEQGTARVHPGQERQAEEAGQRSAAHEARDQSEQQRFRAQPARDHPDRPVQAEEQNAERCGPSPGDPRDETTGDHKGEGHEEVPLEVHHLERPWSPKAQRMIDQEEGGQGKDRQGQEASVRGGARGHDAFPVFPARAQVLEVEPSVFEKTGGNREDFSVVGDPPGTGSGEQMQGEDENDRPKHRVGGSDSFRATVSKDYRCCEVAGPDRSLG
jgi:hypothetical protein